MDAVSGLCLEGDVLTILRDRALNRPEHAVERPWVPYVNTLSGGVHIVHRMTGRTDLFMNARLSLVEMRLSLLYDVCIVD